MRKVRSCSSGLSWFIKEKQPEASSSSLLILSIFLPLVHNFWRLEHKNTDDKSIKGSFTFSSCFSLPDKSFWSKFFPPPSLLHIICLHTEGFVFKDICWFSERKKSVGKRYYMTVICSCPTTTTTTTTTNTFSCGNDSRFSSQSPHIVSVFIWCLSARGSISLR